MPAIAYFLGITVRMYFNDHEPPHFHVWYQGHRARVRIADGDLMDGGLPVTVSRVLREWTVCGAMLSCGTGPPLGQTARLSELQALNDGRSYKSPPVRRSQIGD